MDGIKIDIDVRNSVKKLSSHLTAIQKQQLPFATARALTWTVKKMQTDMIAAMPSIFKIRRKWYLPSVATGIRIQPAKKSALFARLYTNAYFAGLQEHGGTKRPHRSAALLIPTDKTPQSRRIAGGARAMLSQAKVFATPRGIYRRIGNKRDRRVELLYWRSQTAHITPRFGFADRADQSARSHFNFFFNKSLAQALATARR